MKIPLIAIIGLSAICLPLSAGPALSPYMAVSGGIAETAETDYKSFITIPAAGAFTSVQGGMVIGDGFCSAVIQGGQSYQAATIFTEEGYRYRGFYGLNLAAGPRLRFDFLDAYLLAGGMLARYDLSFSYFFFPYVEPGFSLSVLALGDHFSLDIGLSVPIFLRADSFSIGLRAVAAVYYKEKQALLPWAGKNE